MLKYKCHKVVKATAMNRLAYNNYRGWDLPENENGSDDGGVDHEPLFETHLHHVTFLPLGL